MANEYSAYNLINTIFYPEDSFTEEENGPSKEVQVLNMYGAGSTDNDALENISTSYIEFPDRITNVNGAHIYKLISSKDIDWENAFLKFSAVNEKNWGSFDKKRRWLSDTSIYVNDVYELFNVIDYLLCSCEDLWSEINKLKYKGESDVLLYFVENATSSNTLGNEINESIFKTDEKKTYLDPYQYYTLLKIENFGIATEIYKEGESFTLFMPEQYSNHVLTGNASPASINYSNGVSSAKTNEGGVIVIIYGNKIKDSIRLYPGSYIANFLNGDNIKNATSNSNGVVDIANHKLLYSSIYCRDKNNPIKLHQISIDFLKTPNSESYDDYALYYLANNKKHIIYISNPELIDSIKDEYEGIINNSIDYLSYVDGAEETDSNHNHRLREVQNIQQPCLYVLQDEFKSKLQLSTVGNDIGTIPQKMIDIDIYYYKRENDLTVTNISVDNTSITRVKDTSENNNILYSNYLGATQGRYNIPASKTVKINYTATYIDTNPQIKLDDEYEDVMVFEADGVIYSNNEYYKYNTNQVIIGGNNATDNHKRNFDLNTKNDYSSIEDNNIFHDLNKKPFKILYHKLQNPYSLSYTITSNSLLTNSNVEIAQSLQNAITKIENNEQDNQYSYLQFTHNLPDGVEQVKFDLELKIKETSKVKECSVQLPFNLNKIYSPTINFISYDVNREQLAHANFSKNLLIVPNPTQPGQNNVWTDDLDNNQEVKTMTLEEIYNEEYQFRNDGKFVDLPTTIYGDTVFNDITTACSLNDYSYSNTKETNKEFYMFYDDSYRSISLLGNNYVQKKLPKGSYLGYALINNVEAYYIFNINNLSYNYTPYCKGTYYYHTAYNAELNQNLNVSKKSAQLLDMHNTSHYDELIYDSYVNATQNLNENNQTNLTYFLNVKIDKNKSVSYSNEDNTTQMFYGDQALEWISTPSNIIHTPCFDIVRTSYELTTIEEQKPQGESSWPFPANSRKITTYIPVAYLYLNRSSFAPSDLPDYDQTTDNAYYKFSFDTHENNEIFGDQIKYNNFINSWSEATPIASNYNDMILHLKLKENYNSSTPPYFYESNDAAFNFKILKSSYIITSGNDPATSSLVIISNIDPAVLYIDYNQYYFLSDLIKINKNILDIPIGCMPWYDGSTKMYKCRDILGYNPDKKSMSPIIINNSTEKTTCMIPFVGSNDGSQLSGDNQKLYNVNKINLENSSGKLSRNAGEYDDGNELFLNEYNKSLFKMNMNYIASLISRNAEDATAKQKVIEVIRHLLDVNDISGFETVLYLISELNSNFKYLNIALQSTSFSFQPKILSRPVKKNGNDPMMNYKLVSTLFNELGNNDAANAISSSEYGGDYELFEYKEILGLNQYFEIIKDGDNITGIVDLYNNTQYMGTEESPKTLEDKYYYQVKLFIENRICGINVANAILNDISNLSSIEPQG